MAGVESVQQLLKTTIMSISQQIRFWIVVLVWSNHTRLLLDELDQQQQRDGEDRSKTNLSRHRCVAFVVATNAHFKLSYCLKQTTRWLYNCKLNTHIVRSYFTYANGLQCRAQCVVEQLIDGVFVITHSWLEKQSKSVPLRLRITTTNDLSERKHWKAWFMYNKKPTMYM